jgi:hypothetical protein
MGMDNVPRCQHLKMNGTQCGSPALRWRRLCFFHERIRRERVRVLKDMSTTRRFDLPLLEDANSVQVALMKVIQMLGSGRLDHRTAGLMLYALQTASCNLRNVNFEPAESTDVVIDRDDIHRTSIGGPQWFEEDFEEEAEDESENEAVEEVDDEEENEGEDQGIAAKPVVANPEVEKKEAGPLKKERAAVKKHVTTEEARMQVAGVVRNFLLKNAAENSAGKSG